uniref:Uncharacterized protein n=1 Tax=Ixodes scapularis TaxID=6945 RepID=A0A4D5S0A7_IXOSC
MNCFLTVALCPVSSTPRRAFLLLTFSRIMHFFLPIPLKNVSTRFHCTCSWRGSFVSAFLVDCCIIHKRGH